MSAAEAVGRIRDGDEIAVGGHSHRRHPMGLIYEMIRQGKRDLKLRGWNNGIDFDILVGAGCVRQVQTSYVGMLQHGLAPHFRRAVENREITVVEDSEVTALARFRAGAMGIPFIPSTSPLGSDLMEFEDETRSLTCPFTGRPLAALRAARPDWALIHAHTADELGNVQIDQRVVQESTVDPWIARSAKNVIVSVERIVETEKVMDRPDLTILPRFLVDAVVELPFGAHPCSCDLRYDYDLGFIDRYHRAAGEKASFQHFLDEYVHVPNHEAYLEKAGLTTSEGSR